MTPYFAYGSNMDSSQMSIRCSEAALRGVAVLAGHRFIINRQGYATVVVAPGSVVCGVVWDIDYRQEQALDRYEGVSAGQYRKATRSVTLASGGSVVGLIYLAADEHPGAPRPGYLELVVEAARRHGLPPAYLNELASWLPGAAPPRQP